MLTFNSSSHTYYLNGVKIPNVTSVLEYLIDYSSVPKFIMQQACERGDYVHKACELLIWESLDESDIVEEYRPYIEGFKLFLKETKFEPHHAEHKVWHKSLRYAGTLDLGGYFRVGKNRRKPRLALIDTKTTFRMMAAVGPQTAAYQEAYNSHAAPEDQFKERYGLRLTKEGKYELMPMTAMNDFTIFKSCLNIHNFLQKGKFHV